MCSANLRRSIATKQVVECGGRLWTSRPGWGLCPRWSWTCARERTCIEECISACHATVCHIVSFKRGNPSQSYGASLTIWEDHTVLPVRYTRFTYPGGMEGWVDLGSLIAAWPGIEPTTAWSQVRRPNRYATKAPCWLRRSVVCRHAAPLV